MLGEFVCHCFAVTFLLFLLPFLLLATSSENSSSSVFIRPTTSSSLYFLRQVFLGHHFEKAFHGFVDLPVLSIFFGMHGGTPSVSMLLQRPLSAWWDPFFLGISGVSLTSGLSYDLPVSLDWQSGHQ